MKNDKTKTIIRLIKFLDKQLEIITADSFSEKEIKDATYKMNAIYSVFEYLFRPYLGISTPLRRKENKLTYNHNEILFNLTPFQETLYTKLETYCYQRHIK